MGKTKDEKLANAPLGKLMLSLAIPSVLAQIINVLYNIVDRIFIGHIPEYGQLALTGIGVSVPILMIISAFSAFVGMGGAPLASIELGKKNTKGAEEILGNSTMLLIVFSVVLTIVFQVFKTPILYLFGASDNTILYASQYISIYLYGTIFVQFALGLNTYITAQGNARVAMISVIIGAIVNIILDPIFIYAFNMGVKGAALATIISQGLSAFWIIRFLLSENSIIKIKKEYLKLDKKIIGKIGRLGISPFIMQSTESLIMVILNAGLLKYGGDLYVGTMSIIGSIINLVAAPIQGIAQGVQPIMSYNFGAKNYKRVKKTFKNMITACLFVSLFLGGIAVLKPEIYVRLFSDNKDLVDLTCKYMPIYFLGMTVFGIQIGCQSTFLALGQSRTSLFIACLRKIFLLTPLAIILPKYLGVIGIYIAVPISDIISVIVTTLMTYRLSFTIKKEIHSNSFINEGI